MTRVVPRPDAPRGNRLTRWLWREPALALTGTAALLLLTALTAVCAAWVWIERQHSAALLEKENQLAGEDRALKVLNEDLESKTHEIQEAYQNADQKRLEVDRLRATAEEARTVLADRVVSTQAVLSERVKAQLELERTNRDLAIACYFQLTGLAERELRDKNPVRARSLVDRCLRPDLIGFRGWELAYLDAESRRRLAANSRDDANGLAFATIHTKGGGIFWRVAEANQGATVKLVKLQDGRFDLNKHEADVDCVALNRDGQLLASGDRKGMVVVWDAEANKDKWTLSHGAPVRCLAFSPDGGRLASGGEDGSLMVWNLQTGAAERALRPRAGAIRCLAFTPKGGPAGQLLCSVSEDDVATLWRVDAEPGKEEPFALRGCVRAAVSADGKRLALARAGGALLLVDPVSWKVVTPLEGFQGEIRNVAFSADGVRVAAAGRNVVKVWKTDGRLLQTIRTAAPFAFNPDGDTLATVAPDGAVTVWLLDKDPAVPKAFFNDGSVNAIPPVERQSLRNYDSQVLSVAFSPDGKHLISAAGVSDPQGTAAGELKRWDLDTGDEDDLFRGHNGSTGRLSCVAVSPDGRLLAGAGKDQSISFWDLVTGAVSFTIPGGGKDGHADEVEYVAFSPDGKLLASASKDKTVKIWDVASHALAATLSHPDAVSCVAFGDKDRLLAAAGADGFVTLWDAAPGKDWRQVTRIQTQSGAAEGVAFDPRGGRLVFGGADGDAILWDLAGQKALQTLKGHIKAVTAVAFTPDGKRLASASMDGTVRVWDPETGNEALVLAGQTRLSGALAFSPDGTRLAAGGLDGVKVWAARPVVEK